MIHRRRLFLATAATTAVLLGLTALPAGAAPAGENADKAASISGALLAELESAGTADFMVYLKERADLSAAAQAPTADARATQVFQRLTATAARTQADLKADLTAKKAEYKSFWLANALWVKGDRSLVNAIAASDAVERIEQSKSYPLITPTPVTAEPGTTADTKAVEWGVSNVQAPQVWTEFGTQGEGITVANIDTGVDFDHPALVGKYRGTQADGTFDHNYNWFDGSGVCGATTPCDNHGHGTHTMGTMVGDDGAGNQVGVAPGAKWIAAKGCGTNECTDAALLGAGQFVLAPTDTAGNNPRPDLHADVVNNSWGGGRGDLWYEQTVDSWIAAGIFPAFASGNDGRDGCDTTESPGDYPQSYSVGAYDVNNAIADFSGRGTSAVDDGIKPNIAAPGVNVRSSLPGGGYGSNNGTSMATPHLSGAVALAWSAAPALAGDVDATKALLNQTAIDADSTSCGGTAANNNNFGEGRLSAYQLVLAAPRGPSGAVSGTVTDSGTGDGIAGATVTLGRRTATTDADGSYELLAPAGAQELSASAYGYHAKSATVTVPEDGTATLDFPLTAAPVVTVTGKVTDGSGHGWPLAARVSIAGRPGAPVTTNPVTGEYSFEVAGNASYDLTVTADYPGYQTVTSTLELGASNESADIAVPVLPACTAPGYAVNYSAPLVSEAFGSNTPDGWTVTNRTTHGGWVFNDPGSRGNLTGGQGAFAIADSDDAGTGTSLDTDLVTPPLDLTGVANPILKFNSDYRGFSNGFGDVDFSVDGGATWSTVSHWTTASRRGPVVEELALTGAGGKASVLVRFRYQAAFAWWWQLDNVSVVNRSCDPTPGGLVVGHTKDLNTGGALNGVKVSNGDDAGTSAGAGYYWLFSSVTGSREFTATKSGYQPTPATVAVKANDATQANFSLAAGRLTVSPASVEAYQPLGSTRTAKIKVTNTGTAPATVDFVERSGDFSLLSRAGAAPVERWVKGISAGMSGRAATSTSDIVGTAAYEEAWTKVPDLPAAVYDNATATLDGKLYAVGGGSSTGNEAKAWVYDPAEQAWSGLPAVPTGRAKPAAAAAGGKLYVFGGWGAGGDPVATVDVFDPATGAWSTLGATNPAPTAATAVSVAGGKVYLVGGCLDGECAESDRTVVFDPASGAFSEAAKYPQALSWGSCGGIAGKVYCAGGLSGDASTKKGWVYEPGADAWTALPDLPIDLWASAYAGASGLLVIAGGVTNNFATITNRAVAYDPTTGAWQNLPNTVSTVYRGAGACGAYKVGGSPTSWVGSATTEVLGGLDECEDAGDLPWLSTSPASFTVAPGKTQTVTVTLNATVEQPGVYTGSLGVASNTPYQVPATSVKMTVTPPPSWGKLSGTVLGSTCEGTTVPVKATIRINSLNDPTVGYTVTPDAAGKYAYWVPRGRYEIIVAKDGWTPQAKRQQITAGIVSTVDYNLVPSRSCPVV
ncbi:S8 family serine peptidase [Actinomycetes bacterium KLBMP 9797]